MSDVKTLWKRHQAAGSSLVVTYLWFAGFVIAFGLIVVIPAVISAVNQPATYTFEHAFNSPDDGDWTVSALERQLQAIDEKIKVIPASDSDEEHDADYLVTWNRKWTYSEIGPDPIEPMVRDVLNRNRIQPQGLSISSRRSIEGFDLSRSVSPVVWLPMAMIAMAFFYWQQRYKNAIARPTKSGNSLKAIALALAVSIPLAPIIGFLVGWMSPESAHRIPSLTNWLNNWPVLFSLIVLIPLTEEIVFRGWLLERLSQVLAPSISLLISAAAFSAVHPMGLVANLIFLLPGLVWGYLWLRYRSILVCTVAHGAYNATVLLMARHLQV